MTETFRARAIPTPELDARLLICHALDMSHETFAANPEADITDEARELALGYAARRCAREPVSRILGMREFWGLEFAVAPETLDPRPDTETLVRASLEVLDGAPGRHDPRILDIGTGSGCVLVSVLHEHAPASGVGTDVSESALCTARRNARRHGVDARAAFVCTSWSAGMAGTFDLVVSNPPYISTGAIEMLEPEVRDHDPRTALDGGPDGLDAYRAVIPLLDKALAPGGWVIFEVGAGQSADVRDMFADNPDTPVFETVCEWRDLAGHVRCVGARRSPCL
ncbi:MAG: peptide chain release factor N(5)-glutamine methyltransferase [Pseudomonadota bacterium]